ncbi:MAG: redox-regulated ATPase YchF [Sedimentisphaerales bacterium]|nr:redox-regulated ATPase YchF [Sedimentisphaerales bacterium]
MQVALLGLTQSGKSTIFSASSGKQIPPGGAMGIEEAIVAVPDERLNWLTGLYKPKKTVHATVDVLDVPGFDFTSEHGRTAARRLIGQIRTVDMLVFVVRGFENPAVPAYRDSVDPKRDLAELRTEVLLADLELVTTRIEKLEKQVMKPTKTQAHDKAELVLQKKLQEAIESEKPISSVVETEEERAMIKSLEFLTLKPIGVVVNVGEGDLDRKIDLGGSIDDTVPVVTLSAKIELELAQLDEESRRAFMSDLGIQESAAGKFVKICYAATGLISFLTVGDDEVRAWPIRKGTIAVDAAGKVHSDIKRGFIRAETMAYGDLKLLGDEKAVKAAGKMRLEGKEYIVNDGDVINFRFNI